MLATRARVFWRGYRCRPSWPACAACVCLPRSRHAFRASARLQAGHPLDRACDAAKEAAKIGNVDERKQQSCDPENMHVREESKQAQDCDDLELDFWPLCATRSGSVCKRKNKMPNPTTDTARITAVTTMSTSVSPGAVMNTGKWCRSSGMQLLSHMEILS